MGKNHLCASEKHFLALPLYMVSQSQTPSKIGAVLLNKFNMDGYLFVSAKKF